jgi:5-methylcytosine-specific restriction endonuclease McrA
MSLTYAENNQYISTVFPLVLSADRHRPNGVWCFFSKVSPRTTVLPPSYIGGWHMASRSNSTEETDQMGLGFEQPKRPGQKTAPRQVKCRQCDKPFEVPSWAGDDEVELRFCSRQCRQDWTGDTPTFEVKVGHRNGHRGGNWKVQAQKARERDGFACRICGISEQELGRRLDVHHKIPYVSFRSNVEANKLEHLVSVCSACHNRLEAEVRRTLPLFNQK